DENNKTVYHEVVDKITAFMRPYNFEGLPEGKYSVIVEDESGKTVEKVQYKSEKIEKLIRIAKLEGEQNKVLLSISSQKPEDVFVCIFDKYGALVYNEIQTVGKEFAQVYNLNEIKSFKIEVWDKYGQLKKFINY
ncbi:MAG TPA: hypothetical protein DGG95_18640, partial [Cytophagales bacterium]|nr:hypothetical protein [Cytophagales bacterium]